MVRTTLAAATLAAPALAVEIPWQIREIETAEDQVREVLAIDFDADGDLDVLSASSRENRVRLYESDGMSPPTFTTVNLITDAFGVTSIAAADLDGDGDIDVIAALNEGIDGFISWFEQTPGAEPEAPPVFVRHDLALTPVATRVRVADLDGDGDLDVYFASAGEIAWLENDGAADPMFTTHALTTSIGIPTDVLAADVTDDGDLDLVATGTSGARLAWFESDGLTPPGFTEHAIATTLVKPRALAIGDLNADQALDLVVTSRDEGALAWYASDAAAAPGFTETIIATGESGADSVAIGDLDFSGTPDIVLGALASDAVRWFDSDGADPPAFTARDVTAAPGLAPEDVEIADLNGDGAPDVLYAASGTDTVAYAANELAPVRNLTLGAVYQTIAEALAAARPGDVITAASFRFEAEPAIDLAGVGVTLRASQAIDQPAGGAYTLADNATLAAGGGRDVSLAGTLTAPIGARVAIDAAAVALAETGQLIARPSSVLVLDSAGVENAGLIDILGADVVTDGSLENAGEIAIVQGALAASGIVNSGAISGSGDLLAPIDNAGEITLVADALIAGDVLNDGTITIQGGALTVLGDITGEGAIVGQSLSRGGGGAEGVFVTGTLATGPGARLELPAGAVLRIAGGGFTPLSTDASLVDLVEAEVRFVGSGAEQSLEALSADLGPVEEGFLRGEPGAFPIGTLRIGPTPALVRLVDDAENAPGPGAEAIYTDRLVVEPGAELITGGLRVYARQALISGTVDDAGNIVIVTAPGCAADLSGDGVVGAPDLAALIAGWGGSVGDLTGDGVVGAADLATLVAAWGPCD
jgi:hypothetical protein